MGTHCLKNHDTINDLPQNENNWVMAHILIREEVENTLKSCNKVPGKDRIPVKVLHHGGDALLDAIMNFIVQVQNGGGFPQNYVDTILASTFNVKGYKSNCNDSLGVSLLSLTSKVFTRILLDKLVTYVPFQFQRLSQLCAIFEEKKSISVKLFLQQHQQIQRNCIIHMNCFCLRLKQLLFIGAGLS